MTAIRETTPAEPVPQPGGDAPERSGEYSLSPERYRSQPPVAAPKPKEKPVRGLVLTVDDSLIIRRAIASTLQKEGYQVIEAEDGMNALKLLNNCLPDVILLDIAMPMMDGYEVCRLIRKNPILKSIPVVMLSGKDGFFDKVKGKMAGSTQYLTKPFQPALLIATVEKYRRPETPSGSSPEAKSAWGLT
jgi:twitching motility two-component system response regulator PilG